jgi:hypothetical protein
MCQSSRFESSRNQPRALKDPSHRDEKTLLLSTSTMHRQLAAPRRRPTARVDGGDASVVSSLSHAETKAQEIVLQQNLLSLVTQKLHLQVIRSFQR